LIFALGFVLFFALDALIIFNFDILGMLYMNFLMSGTGLAYLVFCLNKRYVLRDLMQSSFLYILLLLHVLSVLIYHTFTMMNYLLRFTSADNISMFDTHYGWGETCLSVVLLIIFVFRMPSKSPLYRWIVAALFVTALRYLEIAIIDPMPMLLYRYDGILDLGVLFIWFVIADRVLRWESNRILMSNLDPLSGLHG
jgi:hypothetical protein